VETEDIQLPAFDAKLSFSEILGRGTSGASVLKCMASWPDGKMLACAAKVLPLVRTTFPDMIEDLAREIEFMRGIQHPALISFVGACKCPCPASLVPPGDDIESQTCYALCIELCDSGLDQYLKNRGNLGTE
jgi:hypothetical protein